MYTKVILYSLLLIIHNALCAFYHEYNRWSKMDSLQWEELIRAENLSFLNESTFAEDPLPQYPFYLQIDKSSIPTLLPNALKNCSTLKGLFLSDINISTISKGVFDGLEQLIEIDLSENKLTQVEDGVFNKIQNLKYLNLSYNYIKHVSELSFTGLQKLNYLYLQGNEISLLSNNVFESQVKSLLKLDLSSNKFQDIAVKGLNHLTHLFLQMNNISGITPDSLNSLTSLQHLDVSHNNIQHIQDLGLEHLNNISLQNNKISSLDSDAFSSQKKSLTVLNMSLNSLKEINTVFHGMIHLTHLYLQLNDISTLDPDSFKDLSSLQYLDLSHNSIRDLSEHIFLGSETIFHLYLQNNKITFLDSDLFESQKHSLITLNISSNSLREISTAFRGMSHLTDLYLQENQIASTAANSFEDLSSLEYLDISHNNLERFQFGLLDHLDHLKYLNFSHNKFEEFPFAFVSYLTYLKELIFDNNKIKSLNATEILHHFPVLRKINLSGNFNLSCTKLVTLVKQLRVKEIEVLKGNYFKGSNVRGMACIEDDFVSGKESEDKDIKSEENNEINPKYTDKSIKDLINIIQEKQNNGNVFTTILITTSTIALILMASLQTYSFIKLKRYSHKDNVELL